MDVSLSLSASPETIVGMRLMGTLDQKHLARTIVEVTEHARVADYEEIHRAMRPLPEANVLIAIDAIQGYLVGRPARMAERPEAIRGST